jgi:bifunctional DNase/RNase
VQDTLSFTLGKDKGVVVERIQIESFQEKNFFGNKVTETKGWDITVRNTKSTAINLNVLDQVPLSSNEDIEIDLKERSGASFDESTGKLKWNIELEPGQAKTLRFVYEITYPDDQQITRQ